MSPSRETKARDHAPVDTTAPKGAPADTMAPKGAPIDAAARKRAAVETFARHEASLRRTAGRYSICADDADEALQRGLEILLQKAPSADPRELVRWTQTVVKHEALAVRAERERILAGPAASTPEPGREDWVAMLPADSDGPAERAERHEAIERSREALATLKPQELRALTLLAEGYSYREIGELTGFSATKVNRCLAEGRERFRHFLVRREGGARCAELAPLLSAFADGEADAGDATTLREHLRSCPHCRATLRAYRAAPRAAAALAPVLPVHGHLVGRLHDAYAALATRVGGGPGASDSALGGFAAAGGTRGAGMAALAKVLAICAGTVGGAAACVASGVVPAPLLDPPDHQARPAAKVSRQPRHLAEEAETVPTVEYQPASPAEAEPEPAPAEDHHPADRDKPKAKREEPGAAAAEEAAASLPPPSESGAVEYTEPPPAPAPVETTSSTSSSAAGSSSGSSSAASSGSAVGEFGP
ncbi:MAG TPA: sigma-70 family RNA polymerase sigma factor [Solirubrobacterales bacterium]|nr:sigma-70 family RNA polymerase sigma factor [Solirubrobacterales bacterium]